MILLFMLASTIMITIIIVGSHLFIVIILLINLRYTLNALIKKNVLFS